MATPLPRSCPLLAWHVRRPASRAIVSTSDLPTGSGARYDGEADRPPEFVCFTSTILSPWDAICVEIYYGGLQIKSSAHELHMRCFVEVSENQMLVVISGTK